MLHAIAMGLPRLLLALLASNCLIDARRVHFDRNHDDLDTPRPGTLKELLLMLHPQVVNRRPAIARTATSEGPLIEIRNLSMSSAIAVTHQVGQSLFMHNEKEIYNVSYTLQRYGLWVCFAVFLLIFGSAFHRIRRSTGEPIPSSAVPRSSGVVMNVGSHDGQAFSEKDFERIFANTPSNPEVVEECQKIILSYLQHGEQEYRVPRISNDVEVCLKYLAPSMGIAWMRDDQNDLCLVRCEGMSTDPKVMKARLMDFLKDQVMKNGGCLRAKDLQLMLPIDLNCFMEGVLNVKQMKKLEYDCAMEIQAAGLRFDNFGMYIFLRGLSEKFLDATHAHLSVEQLRATRKVLQNTLASMDGDKPPTTGNAHRSFLDSPPGTGDELRLQRAGRADELMLEKRKLLPVFAFRDEILDQVRNNQVVLILGATGCGKTTQIPQYLLEDETYDECRVVATQPRRLSACSVAERVAKERGENIGETVAYKIRFEDTVGTNTRLVFCTTGILLNIMQDNPELQGATHLVIDEVHERDLQTDFLLNLVRTVVTRRPDLKVVLMSATVDPSAFQEYYPSMHIIEIPGRTNYPVEELFIEDLFKAHPPLIDFMDKERRQKWEKRTDSSLDVTTDEPEIQMELNCSDMAALVLAKFHSLKDEKVNLPLIKEIVSWIHYSKGEGAVLVFVPGWKEIREMTRMLETSSFRNDIIVYPLHSRIPNEEQQAIFDLPPPGKRKVIVSTVIAETSLTIEDVVFVVDSGKNKTAFFNDSSYVAGLRTVWYSKANALQRRGRAGRCKPGAWYRVYSSLQWNYLSDYELPEMLRSPLEELCMLVASLRLGTPAEFLATSISPPQDEVVDYAVKLLYDLGAITDQTGAELTPLGRNLVNLKVHPMLGKMVLLSTLFGCYNPILTICASLGYKSPFISPQGREREADAARYELAGNTRSDHLTLVAAYDGWKLEDRPFAEKYYISGSTMAYIDRIRRELSHAAYDVLGGVPADHENINYLHDCCRAVLAAGLYPNLAWIGRSERQGKGRIINGNYTAKVHPKSVNRKKTGKPLYNQPVAYYQIQETTERFMYDTTAVEVLPLLLFAPSVKEVARDGSSVLLTMGDWKFVLNAQAIDEFFEVRRLTSEFINASVGHLPTQLQLDASEALARLFTEHAPMAPIREGQGDALRAVLEADSLESFYRQLKTATEEFHEVQTATV